jgi:YggT family protein
VLINYSLFVELVAKIFLALGALAGAICIVDWAIRTRKISPFNRLARFFRNTIDPLLRPIEGRIVRMGGQPSSAPLWVFLGIVIVGIVLIQLLRYLGGLLAELSVVASEPHLLPSLLIGWAFGFLTFALIVRVVSTWLPISPHSKWVWWSYRSTEWLLAPIRRFVPRFGAVDVTPFIAYILIWLVRQILRV